MCEPFARRDGRPGVEGLLADRDEVFALARTPFSIPVAHAGHSGEDDPSSNYDRFAENLAAPVAYDFAEVDFEFQAYCQFHFVYGPANGSTPGLPVDADLVGKSVHVLGSWQGPEGGAWTEFDISVSHANGKLIDLADAEIGELGERPSFRLVRDWRRAFDGVDFVRASQWELDLAVLANLVDSARLEIGEI